MAAESRWRWLEADWEWGSEAPRPNNNRHHELVTTENRIRHMLYGPNGKPLRVEMERSVIPFGFQASS